MEWNTVDTSNTAPPQPEEVVLTYRSREHIPPVELRLERPLPQWNQRQQELHFEKELERLFGEGDKPRRKGLSRRGKILIASLSLAALILLGVGMWFVQRDSYAPPVQSGDTAPDQGEDPSYSWDDQEYTDEETSIDHYRPYGGSVLHLELQEAGDALILTPGEIYEKLRDATVTVIGERETGYGVGTGIICSSDGYVLTNYHVIAGSYGAMVWITDRYGVDKKYDALLVGGDADQDLAVLKIEGENLPVAELGVSDALQVGDPVYAIGNPLGLELRATFTDGIVSAVNREVDVDGIIMTLIQTNAALNSGNSGGPLINQYGQVVGINTIKMMSGYDNTIEGLGFAIPTSISISWINDLIADGEIAPQPVLGVSIDRIPVTLEDGTVALRVVQVTEGLAADKAGIRVDDYMVSFNNQNVGSTEDVLAIRRTLRVGDSVPVLIWRDGEYLELTMVLTAQNH